MFGTEHKPPPAPENFMQTHDRRLAETLRESVARSDYNYDVLSASILALADLLAGPQKP